MAGRGPAPKHPDKRGGHRRAEAMKVIIAEPVEQPELPSLQVEVDGNLTEFVWPAATERWWQMWRDSPLSAEFTASDWSFLADTALLHARLWMGQTTVAPELRLRVAKFGATPEDRARLRITFAQADEADEKRGTRQASSARDRYQNLRLADGA